MTPLEAWIKSERELQIEVMDLCRGMPAQYNIAPVMDLVRAAKALGFDVVRKTTSDNGTAEP